MRSDRARKMLVAAKPFKAVTFSALSISALGYRRAIREHFINDVRIGRGDRGGGTQRADESTDKLRELDFLRKSMYEPYSAKSVFVIQTTLELTILRNVNFSCRCFLNPSYLLWPLREFEFHQRFRGKYAL